MEPEEIREMVRRRYARLVTGAHESVQSDTATRVGDGTDLCRGPATGGGEVHSRSSGPEGSSGCCGGAARSEAGGGCCGGSTPVVAIGRTLGYSDEELQVAPEGANLGLGCGNPLAIASLRPGETVLDLGCGAGFDCFLAARQVGEIGRVIGVDMTPEMLARARENARKGGFTNVEFRLGEIEHLPVADQSVDVVISNCVINLSPEKEQVFREAFRVLPADVATAPTAGVSWGQVVVLRNGRG